jgi:hypothetical protein
VALADLQAAAGQRFFSIGGSLDLAGKTGTQLLFSGSETGDAQRLVLEVAAVPEPSSLAMLGLGAAGLLGYRGWCRRTRPA